MPSPLEAWGNFYVIVGSSAGALTGLQFVVMTLIAQTGPSRTRGETISAFGTPNVVHFCSALLVAAILTVPWSAVHHAGFAIALCGVLGSFYSVVVMRRARRQREYQPVLEDWLWHTMFPSLAYLTLLAAGAALEPAPAQALLAIGAAVLLLVFIGIHNSWDTVTYLTTVYAQGERKGEAGGGGGTPQPAAGAGDPPARVAAAAPAAASGPAPPTGAPTGGASAGPSATPAPRTPGPRT